MNVVCVHEEALNDDDGALAHEELVQAQAVADAQTDIDVGAVVAQVAVLADDVWKRTALPLGRKKVQKKQLHELGQVLIEEGCQE
jgi:hypothetical protein